MDKRYIMHASAAILFAFTMGLATTACSDDDQVEVPENWVTVSTEPLSVGYQGTGENDLELDYTLAGGLDGRVTYVVNHESWCSGYIGSNGKLLVKVEESGDVHGRSATMDLMYDTNHKVTLTVNQGKAPVIPVTGFDDSGIPSTINLDEALDLSEAVKVLPANASFKTLTFELISGEEFVTLSGNSVIGVEPGEAKIKVTATSDAEVVGAGISTEVTVKVKGDRKLNRSKWTVKTIDGLEFCPDDAINGAPECLFDGKMGTCYSICKPGKSYGGTSTPAGATIGFIVDMQSAQKFNYVIWTHRNTNQKMLQVWGAKLLGSNDGNTFTEIQTITLDQGSQTQTIELTKTSEYRYVRVEYADFNASSGSSAQVAEFQLGLLTK